MNLLLSRPSGTLSPAEGERDGVRGPLAGSRAQGAFEVRGVLSCGRGVGVSVSSNPIFGLEGGQPIHLVTSVAAVCGSRALSPAREIVFSVWVSLPAAARAGRESPSAARTPPRR